MKTTKISELTESKDLTGLYTIGTDKDNNSVKVSLERMNDTASTVATQNGTLIIDSNDTSAFYKGANVHSLIVKGHDGIAKEMTAIVDVCPISTAGYTQIVDVEWTTAPYMMTFKSFGDNKNYMVDMRRVPFHGIYLCFSCYYTGNTLDPSVANDVLSLFEGSTISLGCRAGAPNAIWLHTPTIGVMTTNPADPSFNDNEVASTFTNISLPVNLSDFSIHLSPKAGVEIPANLRMIAETRLNGKWLMGLNGEDVNANTYNLDCTAILQSGGECKLQGNYAFKDGDCIDIRVFFGIGRVHN